MEYTLNRWKNRKCRIRNYDIICLTHLRSKKEQRFVVASMAALNYSYVHSQTANRGRGLRKSFRVFALFIYLFNYLFAYLNNYVYIQLE